MDVEVFLTNLPPDAETVATGLKLRDGETVAPTSVAMEALTPPRDDGPPRADFAFDEAAPKGAGGGRPTVCLRVTYTLDRAVSADGVAVGLRTVENPKDGTLAFWSQAIEGEMTGARGYKLEKAEDIAAAGGAPGRLLTFTAQRSGADFTYLLAVYVSGRQVLIAEAGGRSERVAEKIEPIRKSLLSVR